jgi:NAD-dependent DNA ligase
MYNIVPYFLESYHNGDYPIPLPTKCPICGAPLDYNSGVIVKCKNPDCKGLKLGAIIRHAEKMRMVGLGEGVLTKLYDNEFVTKIEDLYDLRKWDDCIAQTEGFGYTSYDNMVKSVDKALSEATLARFLGAMPFNDTDEKTWSIVIRELGEEQIIRTMLDGTFPETIMNAGYIPSVGKIKIQKIFDGYLRNKEEIQSLMSWIPEKLKPTTPWGAYAGRVCFTGFRDKDLEKQLVDNGYEVGGFTNDLKALIVKDKNFQSDKVSRAKKLNIPIYTPDEVPDNLFEPF